MGLRDRLLAAATVLAGRVDLSTKIEPRFQTPDAGVLFSDLGDPELAEYLTAGGRTNSGAIVNERSALCQGVAWRCASIICGVVATLPRDLMLREDEWSRKPATDELFRDVLTVKPNNRQTPSEFLRMLQLHKLQRGDGLAMKIVSRGRIAALWPLDPLRMDVIENADLSLTYRYSRKDGTQHAFAQNEILHLRGLSWDGVRGMSVIAYHARETIGLAQQIQAASAKVFKNGQFTSGFLKSPNALSDTAYNRLKNDVAESGGIDSADAYKLRILEEGLEFQERSMTAVDAQLMELAGFTRTDVGMFYGVPPFLYGDTQKSTSWGTGIEQQKIGFLQFTMEDHLTCWSEALKRDCLAGGDPRLYVHFDLKGFLRADTSTRARYLSLALGAGGGRPWMTQNQVCAYEDLPKRPASEPWADELPAIGSARITDTISTDANGEDTGAQDGNTAPPGNQP